MVKSLPGTWGQTKRRVQLLLTPECVDLLDKIGRDMGISRGEVIERMARYDFKDELSDVAPPFPDGIFARQ